MSHLLAFERSVGLNLRRLLLGISGALSLAVPVVHAAARRTVVAWGDNSSGQANVFAGLSDVTAVAAGDLHTLALRSDGTIVAWRAIHDDYNYGQASIPPGWGG
jgi:hypothetical protein